MLDEILKTLIHQLEAANKLKTGERSEQQRRLAIFCTELEKTTAFGAYVNAAS